MSNNVHVTSGVGPCFIIGLVFLILKLCGVIAWSWWWVLLPFYGPLVLVLLALAIIVAISAFVGR